MKNWLSYKEFLRGPELEIVRHAVEMVINPALDVAELYAEKMDNTEENRRVVMIQVSTVNGALATISHTLQKGIRIAVQANTPAGTDVSVFGAVNVTEITKIISRLSNTCTILERMRVTAAAARKREEADK